MKLEGNVILVAGGASGLGAACAQRFVSQGARVVIADLNESAATALAAELGPSATSVVTDVTSPTSMASTLAFARELFGPLRGVVNCAGILGAARLLGRDGPHDLELFSRVIHVNLIGSFNVLRLAAQHLQENPPDAAGERGVILHTASVAAYEGQIGQAAYAASKGGVAALMLPAARELARLGIRVLAIAPGVFETPMMQSAPVAVRQSMLEQTVFPPRFGEPSEFASLAQHALENPMLNGTVIRLDGGLRLAPK